MAHNDAGISSPHQYTKEARELLTPKAMRIAAIDGHVKVSIMVLQEST